MGGCDKTTPGLVMGALSMGLPFIYLPAGPMLRGNYAGRHLGSGTDDIQVSGTSAAPATISKEAMARDRRRASPAPTATA